MNTRKKRVTSSLDISSSDTHAVCRATNGHNIILGQPCVHIVQLNTSAKGHCKTHTAIFAIVTGGFEVFVHSLVGHQVCVNLQRFRSNRSPRVVMTAITDGHPQIVLPGKVYTSLDVFCRLSLEGVKRDSPLATWD